MKPSGSFGVSVGGVPTPAPAQTSTLPLISTLTPASNSAITLNPTLNPAPASIQSIQLKPVELPAVALRFFSPLLALSLPLSLPAIPTTLTWLLARSIRR